MVVSASAFVVGVPDSADRGVRAVSMSVSPKCSGVETVTGRMAAAQITRSPECKGTPDLTCPEFDGSGKVLYRGMPSLR